MLTVVCSCGRDIDDNAWTKEPEFTARQLNHGCDCLEWGEEPCKSAWVNCPDCRISMEWKPCTF